MYILAWRRCRLGGLCRVPVQLVCSKCAINSTTYAKINSKFEPSGSEHARRVRKYNRQNRSEKRDESATEPVSAYTPRKDSYAVHSTEYTYCTNRPVGSGTRSSQPHGSPAGSWCVLEGELVDVLVGIAPGGGVRIRLLAPPAPGRVMCRIKG